MGQVKAEAPASWSMVGTESTPLAIFYVILFVTTDYFYSSDLFFMEELASRILILFKNFK